jgi:hypothetical protein
MIAEGRKARHDVKDAILREKITTSGDASIPNVPITDAATAEAEALAIEKHVLEMTAGKSFSELADDDPNNEAAFRATSLRTSLNLAVMGFKVSELVVGMGAFLVAVGGTFVAFLAPAVYWAAQVANRRASLAEPESSKAAGQVV